MKKPKKFNNVNTCIKELWDHIKDINNRLENIENKSNMQENTLLNVNRIVSFLMYMAQNHNCVVYKSDNKLLLNNIIKYLVRDFLKEYYADEHQHFRNIVTVSEVRGINSNIYNGLTFNSLLIGPIKKFNIREILTTMTLLQGSYSVYYNSYKGKHLFYICKDLNTIVNTISCSNFIDNCDGIHDLINLRDILKEYIIRKVNGYSLNDEE